MLPLENCPNIDRHGGHPYKEGRCPGHDQDPVLRLMEYKEILDSGRELDDWQKADLEAIGEYVVKMIQEFVSALTEAVKPFAEAIVKAARELNRYLDQQAPRVDVAQFTAQNAFNEGLLVPKQDSEARTAQHYTGRGGW